jgi:hypothetical protein
LIFAICFLGFIIAEVKYTIKRRDYLPGMLQRIAEMLHFGEF